MAAMGSVLVGCASDSPCPSQPGVLCTVAGTGITDGSEPDEGPAVAVDIGLPIDVVAGPDQALYILDLLRSSVRRLDLGSEHVTRVAGSVGPIMGCPDGQSQCDARDFRFGHPVALAFDGQDMLVADFTGSIIVRIREGRVDTGSNLGTGRRDYDGEGGDARSASFNLPSSIVAHPDGGWLVTDQGNQVIRIIDDGNTIDRFAGDCVVWDEATEGVCAGDPIACADSDKTTCSQTTSCDHGCAPAFAGDGQQAMGARLALPSGAAAQPGGRLAVQPLGTVYVADSGNHRVRRIDRQGIIYTVAGDGEAGFDGDNRPATSASLNLPTDVAVGEDGTLYIADARNHCIRAVDRSGIITSVAGVCGHEGVAEQGQPAQTVLLDTPTGIELADGILYIADTGNGQVHAVRVRPAP